MRNKHAALWLWVCLVPLAFDYKAPDSQFGHSAQWLAVIPALAGALILAMIGPRFARRTRLRSFVTGALVASLAGSLIAQLLQHNPIGQYLRVILPFLLFTLGYWAMCRPWHPIRITQMQRALYYAMVLGLVFTFFFGILAVGGPLADIRFRIVSPTMLALQAMLLHQFIVARRFNVSMVLVFLATLVVELLSVTRSLLIATVLLAMFAAWLASPSLSHLIKSFFRTGLALSFVVALGVGTAWLFPSITEHWTQRVTAAQNAESDRDPTTVTRIAEMRDQYDQVTESVESVLFGKGYGHLYRYSPIYFQYVNQTFSKDDYFNTSDWVAGHNFWVYQLYAEGIVFGGCMPLAVIVALIVAGRAFRRWHRIAPRHPMLMPLSMALLVLAALPGASIGGNPLGTRFSGLVYGLALGLIVALYSQLHYRIDLQRKRQRLHPSYGREPAFRPTAPAAAPVPLTTYATPEPR
ncbi:hypothetical protein M3I53_02710 [Paraburkholderia sp. CNPSo 3272]|uniref:sulfite exporter TauE/SafE family protein n=1 Tax=Paraburkholderia sp. CNPSo 3272 TaxID=2940931 RepID=UPI0020B8332C|nr:sulfite exporter TauE/SafE family protein [Paraburkholderia sp. CNPSo 3272]MCP3722046.1 hypothetical protein [Paraburkholderia sp. CNPSo 3272]